MGSIPLPALAIKPPAPPENPVDQYAKILQMQGMQQNQQMQKVQLQQAQQAQQDQQTVRKAFMDNNGDLDKTIAAAAKAGVTPQTLTGLQAHALDVKTKMATLTKDQLANLSQQNDNAAGLIQPVIDAPPEKQPALYAQARASALQNPQAYGITDPSQIPEQFPGADALKSQIAIHKGGKQQAEDAIKQQAAADAKAKNAAELPGLQATSDQKVLANAASNLAGATNQQDYAQRIGELPFKVASQFPAPAQWTPDAKQAILNTGMTPHEQATVPTATLSMQDWLKKNPGKGPSDYEIAMKKIVPAFNFNLQNSGTTGSAPDVAKRFGMSPEAFDQAAEKYNTTGQLPPSGRGGPSLALNKAIMNRSSELHPGESLAENSGAFKANQASLTNLQKTFDSVNAFENTAIKNLDQVAQAGKAIPDLSYRFANVPVRMISSQMVGTPEMAKFKTALLTAQTEAARVLNTANASGVLSDSARHEAQEVLDGKLPFPAMMASINQLKTDFANRHQSYQDQINDIRGRMNHKTAPASGGYTPPAGAQTAVGPDGHKIVVDGGKWVDAQTGKPIQ